MQCCVGFPGFHIDDRREEDKAWISIFIITNKITTKSTTKITITNLISVSAIGGEASEENIRKNTQAPDVCRQADRFIGQDLGSWGFRTSGYWDILMSGFQKKSIVDWQRKYADTRGKSVTIKFLAASKVRKF